VDGNDFSGCLLDLFELSQEVPESGLGDDLVGRKDPHSAARNERQVFVNVRGGLTRAWGRGRLRWEAFVPKRSIPGIGPFSVGTGSSVSIRSCDVWWQAAVGGSSIPSSSVPSRLLLFHPSSSLDVLDVVSLFVHPIPFPSTSPLPRIRIVPPPAAPPTHPTHDNAMNPPCLHTKEFLTGP
jgi:hypothetical protein